MIFRNTWCPFCSESLACMHTYIHTCKIHHYQAIRTNHWTQMDTQVLRENSPCLIQQLRWKIQTVLFHPLELSEVKEWWGIRSTKSVRLGSEIKLAIPWITHKLVFDTRQNRFDNERHSKNDNSESSYGVCQSNFANGIPRLPWNGFSSQWSSKYSKQFLCIAVSKVPNRNSKMQDGSA